MSSRRRSSEVIILPPFGTALLSKLLSNSIRQQAGRPGKADFRYEILAGAEGFEPPTYGFGDRRSSS